MPSTYFGTSDKHIHYNHHSLNPLEPISLFEREDINERTSWLDMKYCKGTIDERTFSCLRKVKYLSLERCNVEDCSRAFLSLEKLSMVQIKESIFPLESKTFEGSKSITTLFIQNFLPPIHPCFYHLNKLKVLFFEKCTFLTVNGYLFSGLNSLKILSIINCKIGTIKFDTFTKLTKLESINIRNNKIESIDSNVFNNLTKVKYFSFHNNDINFELNYTILQQMKSLHTIQFDTHVLKNMDCNKFSHLDRVIFGYSNSEIDPHLDEIVCKLNAKNVSRNYVLFSSINLDSDEN